MTLDGLLAEIEDMPTIGNQVSAHMVSRLVQGYGPVHIAILEKAQTMPRQGIAGAFNYGVGYGKLVGVLATLEIPIVEIVPSHWKRRWGLGKDKNLSRKKATDRWPACAEYFSLVKHDGRAEAALIAATWWEDNRPGLVVQRSKRPNLEYTD